MGLREKMNEKPIVVAAVVAVLVGLVGASFYFGSGTVSGQNYNLTFYSSDGGTTFFTDAVGKAVPFEKDGKEVVRAHVYDIDGKRVVGYVSKMSPELQAATQASEADMAKNPNLRPDSLAKVQALQAKGWLHKRPNESKWTAGGPTWNVDLRTDPKASPPEEVNP